MKITLIALLAIAVGLMTIGAGTPGLAVASALEGEVLAADCIPTGSATCSLNEHDPSCTVTGMITAACYDWDPNQNFRCDKKQVAPSTGKWCDTNGGKICEHWSRKPQAACISTVPIEL